MQHAKNITLREEVYRVYINRASDGDLDNTGIIDQILKLRLEKAKLLGYNNYAEVYIFTFELTIPSMFFVPQKRPSMFFKFLSFLKIKIVYVYR